MVRLETVSTFLRTNIFETEMSNLRPTEEGERFGVNNIICKDSGKQFFVDPAYLDDDVLESLGFLTMDADDDYKNTKGDM